jgi:uncharacterized membrane-anchored protein
MKAQDLKKIIREIVDKVLAEKKPSKIAKKLAKVE